MSTIKKKRGRPCVINPIDCNVTLRITSKDKELLHELSKHHAMSIGALIRKLTIEEGKKIGLV